MTLKKFCRIYSVVLLLGGLCVLAFYDPEALLVVLGITAYVTFAASFIYGWIIPKEDK